ncbi:hypothetical protein AALP_AA5G239300 [Arabis alpina]|uniref:EDS1 EP domain-containing protein n=1 Tax=Arabis alpina TaxID=50452 RepID=A0A087GZ21_ARAAL|nr:hypothetical protein AALP_AA5G239300 [Arabis alpina]
MAFQALTGINGDHIIKSSWNASKEAYGSDHYHREETGDFVFFAFPPFFLKNDWFAPGNKSAFGEIKMDRNKYPCMRSIGNDVDATVNQAFLNNLEVLISPRTSFVASVETDFNSGKQIVFTGHSSGGATAILATVWYLETYYRTNPNGLIPDPRCVTFGAPLVGDRIFKHALGREKWSRFFTNFVTRFDIVPRIMLARKASIGQALPHVLSQLDSNKDSMQENDQEITEFYKAVMKDTATVAYQAVRKLNGNGEAFLETFSSFLELSPYRPVGTFVFSIGNELVSGNNSDAILQILFYASHSSNDPCQSVKDHYSYEQLVQSMEINNLDLHHFLLDGETSIMSALNGLGLSARAGQCVRAALEAEKQRVINQNNIYKMDSKWPKIEKDLTWMEEKYKLRCQTPKNGYYDSFKASDEKIDFKANVKRVELAGIYDEVLGLVKNYQLPDEFEGRKEWIEQATRYRRLIEPLDIANYYRHLKNEDTGPYMKQGRPSRYIYAERGYKHQLLKPEGMNAETVFWNKIDALNLGSKETMREELKLSGSKSGSCFWAEVEELKGKLYAEVEVRIKTLEGLLGGWIKEGEVDQQIFLEGSTYREWWNSLPDDHKRQSPVRHLIIT